MKKLSVKLGIMFFIIFFGLSTLMFFFLHEGIVESRVNEELSSLLARGNSHSYVLAKSFDNETLSHVVLMESESKTDIVVTNKQGNVLGSSDQLQLFEKYLSEHSNSNIPKEGKVIEDNWEKEPYIVTISPISNTDEISGFVYMFQNTTSIHLLIQKLNEHFILTGWISVILTIIIIIFLSRGITKPLIKMKEATHQISKGDFTVTLPVNSNDELGELAHSIQKLAIDLNYLKKERNEFLASISHELRTPITYIKGYADILRKRNVTEEERKKYLSTIVDETNHLNELIKKLFDLAKIDKNSFAIHKETIELNSFLQRIEQKLEHAFKERNIKFYVSCQNNLFFKADPLMLEQILVNLLDNAMKYSHVGAELELNAWGEKNKIHILIRDNGKGIPEKDLPYIFNRFYRVDRSRTRSLGGSGLGLAIVRELVHAHHADIFVKSKENVGTEFELVFQGE